MRGPRGPSSPSPALPRAALWILERVLPPDAVDDIVGDLQEAYGARRMRDGALRSSAWLGWQVARLATADLDVRRAASSGSRASSDTRLRAGMGSRSRRRRRLLSGLESWVPDGRQAIRGLRRAPGFTAVAVLTIAFGIAASSAVFAVVRAVLLEPLPYEEPQRLVLLWRRPEVGGRQRLRVPAPDVAEYRVRATLFEGLAFSNRISDATLSDGQEPMHVEVGVVTENFFSVLGVAPALGRAFAPSELPRAAGVTRGDPATPATAVISHGLWRRRFGSDPAVLGRTVLLDGSPYVVVGVLPESFEVLMPPDVGMPSRVDVWIPLGVELAAFDRPDRLTDQDADNSGAVVGRLRPGIGVAQARAEMDAIAARLRQEVAGYAEAGMWIEVAPLHADVVGHVRPLLLTLAGAVGIVLLIAFLDVANLMLARVMGRRREMAVRAALGAARGRLVRLTALEGALVAALGAPLGLLLARWGMALARRLGPGQLPRLDGAVIDGATLTFAAAATVGAALVCGGLPAAMAWRRAETELLRAHAATAGDRRSAGARSALVAAQVAFSVVLLVAAGLLLRSLAGLRAVDPGFVPDGALTFELSLRQPDRYQGPAERSRFVVELEGRIAALPGVEAVGLVGALPLGGRTWEQPYGLPDQSEADQGAQRADFRMITSGYFEALGVRVLAGRPFTPAEDLHEERRVAIIDELMAERLSPGRYPLGERLGFPLDGEWVEAEIVGVVEEVRHRTLAVGGRATIYVPYRQEASRDLAFVVRTGADPARLATPIRDLVRELDRRLAVHDVRALREYVEAELAPTRFGLAVVGGFGALAIAVAAIGLYGLVAYSVSRRGRELGLRVALGARRADVVRLVLRQAGRPVAAGAAVGLPSAVAAARLLRGILFGVGAADAATLGAVGLLVSIVAMGAAWLPARRAASVSPMVALRGE